MTTAPAPWVSEIPTQTYAPLPVDPDALALAGQLAMFLKMGSSLHERTNQIAIGSSEVGYLCDRRVAYRLHGTRKVNPVDDPLRTLIGIGVHLALAQALTTLDPEQRWFLVERPVMYKGIPGTADLAYVLGRCVVDWKSAKRAKIAHVRRDGVPRHHQVQVHTYGAALRAEGIDIGFVSVVYIPLDADYGTGLDNLWAWRAPLDTRVADDAVERIERLRTVQPADAPARPDRNCAYCSHHRPGSTDLSVGCPGVVEKGNTA